MSVPVQRILRERRRVIIPLVVVAIVNVAVFMFVVYPLSLRVGSLESRTAATAKQADAVERQLAAAKGAAEGTAKATTDLDRFYREVLPADQTGARRITYLRLAQLAQDAHLRYERRSVDTKRERENELTEMKMTMVLDGTYADVRRFIHRLEGSPEFVVIKNVELTQQDDPAAPLLLTVELATYYRAPHGS